MLGGTTPGKRSPSFTDDDLSDIWNVSSLDYSEAELIDFERFIASATGKCLKEDRDSRAEIADLLSSILADRVSEHMLNAYASERRTDHNISAARFLALIAITRRFDILDAVLRRVGGKAIDTGDVNTLKIGAAYLDKVAAHHRFEEVVVDAFGLKP